MVCWSKSLDPMGVEGCNSLVLVEERVSKVGSYLVDFVVGHYQVGFDCCLLDFIVCCLGSSYSNFLLIDFVNQVG